MISALELESFWDEHGASPIRFLLADSRYSLPSRPWIEHDLSRAFRGLLISLEIQGWKPERNDCDDFARLACAFAGVVHAHSPHETGLAFGEFWYERDSDGQKHAICAAVLRAPSGYLVPLFWEPQTQQIITLTQFEIESCTGYRF